MENKRETTSKEDKNRKDVDKSNASIDTSTKKQKVRDTEFSSEIYRTPDDYIKRSDDSNGENTEYSE